MSDSGRKMYSGTLAAPQAIGSTIRRPKAKRTSSEAVSWFRRTTRKATVPVARTRGKRRRMTSHFQRPSAYSRVVATQPPRVIDRITRSTRSSPSCAAMPPKMGESSSVTIADAPRIT